LIRTCPATATNVVVSLFDQMVTFRLKDLQAATKAIHEAERKLKAKPNAKAAELLKQARSFAYSPLVSDNMIKDKEFLELFRKNKKDVAVAKQLTGLEDLWNTKAKSQLRQRRASWPNRPPVWASKPLLTWLIAACAARQRAGSATPNPATLYAVCTADPPCANSPAAPAGLGPLAGLAGWCWPSWASSAAARGAGDLHRLCERAPRWATSATSLARR
jgi:hypothetical protein